MADDVVVRAEDLGKRYTIGRNLARERSATLRQTVDRAAARLRRAAQLGRRDVDTATEFWALRHLDIEVRRGEVLGIIGANGSGKSTFLKILARITKPTEGRAAIRGRVASLLEVGVGFHPDLTGRENIFLYGAVLGMNRAEIAANLDEIVAFAGVDKFLDTPVKRYSSGMYVRLGFAVAAHLRAEILLVDEVLAVGDAEFQKKCLGRMSAIADGGRTVLFVSHNMNAVSRFCSRCVRLSGGALLEDSSDVQGVVRNYLFGGESGTAEWIGGPAQIGDSPIVPRRIFFSDADGRQVPGPFSNDTAVVLNLDVDVHECNPALTFGICLYDENGSVVFWSYTTDGPEETWAQLATGRQRYCVEIPQRFLNEGTYRIEFISSLHFRKWFHRPGEGPYVELRIQGGLSDSPLWLARRPGVLAPVLNWRRAVVGED
jgi:lipopolysaccharide transport system ATP-binding protein